MEKKIKISPFQLTVLLALSRMFTVMTYTPRIGPLPEGSVSLVTTHLSPVAQYFLLMLAAGWCASPKGVSPLLLSGRGARVGHMVFSALYWAFSLVVCLYTVVNFIYFLVTSFYDFRDVFLMAAVFVLCAGFAVSQGLEAFSRAAAVFALVALLGFGAIALGLWGEYDMLNFVLRPWDPAGTIWGIYQGLAMNFELAALLLLLPHTDLEKLRPRMAAGWLGTVAALSAGLILITIFSLGEYAGYQMFPVFAAASSAKVLMFRHLDAVFMAVWVLLGFAKLTVFLFLMASMWGELLRRELTGKMVWANTATVLVLSWAGLAMRDFAEGLYWVTGTGAVTLIGALGLPLVGWLIKWREGRKKNEAEK